MTPRSRQNGDNPVERRSLKWLVLTASLLFQSHWVDDLGGSENDVAGIAVSAVGAIALVAGLFGIRTTSGRILLALGLAFVVWVSLADLIGLGSDGARATDVIAHWRSTLGLAAHDRGGGDAGRCRCRSDAARAQAAARRRAVR